MRYLFVHSAREWSGTARVFASAARGLAERGHVVTFVVEPDSTVERIVSHAATISGRAPLFDVEPLDLGGSWFRAALRLRALIRLRDANVVLVHTEREHWVSAVAYRLGSRAPVVRRIPAGRQLTMRLRGRVASAIAPTFFLFANEHDRQTTTLVRRNKLHGIAPTGVRPLEPRIAARSTATQQERPPEAPYETPYEIHERRNDEQYIVCLHDASSRSKAAMAIRTVAMLAPRHPSLRLVIIGEGAYDDDLRMQAAALNVLPLVSFLGERGDVQQLIREATLGWVVSDTDNAVYGVLDFMNAGVPVLAGEGTIAEQYVLSHITGVLLPATDAFMAAATVANLLTVAGERDTMGHAAHVRVVREFPEHAMIDGFEHAASALPSRRGR